MARRRWLREPILCSTVVLLVACGGGWRATAGGPASGWTPVSVQLPVSDESFPPGDGADAATGYCLICHSAGMVLRQPKLTRNEWRAEVMKMRSAYGAPVPDDQLERLADYLASL
jgi:mono/diheme cytochrome c family protein